MVNRVFKSLKDISAELNVSYETARRAALKGKIPAFQPFGPGSAWCVRPDYESFLYKSRKHGDGSVTDSGANSDHAVKTR
jgi:hypothetical protein